ncbi:hypothetical protein Taro_043795 [Colocasia esculenta]|uniref:Uncharacterized protein n=1 Tax=Colocasia esculenta TaxID=4460 RepID=A0A843X273_COLES|nr:hypothetical protein [Colocasia esculenta]
MNLPMFTRNVLGIPLSTLHYSRIPLERQALVSIYTLSLDLDELFVGYSFCWTSESLLKASVSQTMTLYVPMGRDQNDE